MLILAISVSGHEYFYKASTAHSVPKAAAEDIAARLNKAGYMLKPGECWFVHDIAEFEAAAVYASGQRFYRRNGSIYRKR